MKPDNGQQPGQTVTPSTPSAPPTSSASGASKQSSAAAAPPAPPSPAVTSAPAPVAPAPTTPAPPPSDQPADTATEIRSDPQDPDTITWTASEFIAHAKSLGWYAILAGSAIIFAALVFLISRDIVSVSVVLIAALLLGIYAGHQPRQMEYRIDKEGVGVGARHFIFGDFRSFSIMEEGAFSSIVFMPLKRFAVPTTIYYAPQDEDKIVQMLSDKLPMENRKHDAIDRLLQHIRF